jgi:hypothetical protein
MKGGEHGATDWSRQAVAPLPEHYQDYAELARQVALRYPEVQFFQVWNELKGFWDPQSKAWDAVNYTEFYNLVYQAVKSARPDAKVGGPYIHLAGSGSRTGAPNSEMPITAKDWAFIDYWLAHNVGADFICIDHHLRSSSQAGQQDTSNLSVEQWTQLASVFGDITAQLRTKAPSLPIWWSEYYGLSSPAFRAALLASLVRNGASVALLWGPMQFRDGGNDPLVVLPEAYLFTDVRRPDGGQPSERAAVYEVFQRDFGPGTPIYRATSSDPLIEVLAGPNGTIIANKHATARTVALDGQQYAVNGLGCIYVSVP